MTKTTKIPVIVCEFHQEVLHFIHRFIARKKLPFNNIKMIHLDSHPDLAFPDRFNADDCYCKEMMYNDLDIADWILPLMYAGHIDHLVWVKPPWADQIPDKKTSIAVGKETNTGKLRLTCSEDYFLEDCTFAPRHRLSNIKDVILEFRELNALHLEVNAGIKVLLNSPVSDLPAASPDCNHQTRTNNENSNENEKSSNEILHNKSAELTNIPSDRKHKLTINNMDNNIHKKKKPIDSKELTVENLGSVGLKHLLLDQKYILDIDLDFFSVANPFLQDYTEGQYNRLRKIYELKFPSFKEDHDALEDCVSAARERLNELKNIVESFGSGLSMAETDDNREFIELLKEIKAEKDNVDWEMVHNAGMTTELPHHISSINEIDELINQMILVLKELPRPTLITMARSTVDEYCPPNQIEMIQEKVLSAIKTVYSEDTLEINFDYKDTSCLV